MAIAPGNERLTDDRHRILKTEKAEKCLSASLRRANFERPLNGIAIAGKTINLLEARTKFSMDINKNAKWFLGVEIFVLALFTSLGTAVAAPVSGAIFTTDQNSTFVNGNVYDTATDVYLNGGPRPNAPCSAAGLPDGDYYFQVTDPSGKVLLSYDFVDGSNSPIVDINERKVNVTNGLMTIYRGTTRNTGIGKCSGAITVQLFPYLRTPNPGGEYKVWMTPVSDYACGTVSDQQQCTTGFFGFIPSKSKTDNFKVIDYDGNGIPDSEDACPDGNYPSNAPPCVVPQSVSITATTPTVNAGEPFTFTITLSAPAPSGGLTVDYTTGGSAVNGTDYTLSGSVFIPEGTTTATITAMTATFVTGDTVTLTLTDTSNPACTVDSSSSTAAVTIINPPPPPA